MVNRSNRAATLPNLTVSAGDHGPDDMPSSEEASWRAVLVGGVGQRLSEEVSRNGGSETARLSAVTPWTRFPQTPPSVPRRRLLLTCHPLLPEPGDLTRESCTPTGRGAPPILGAFQRSWPGFPQPSALQTARSAGHGSAQPRRLTVNY